MFSLNFTYVREGEICYDADFGNLIGEYLKAGGELANKTNEDDEEAKGEE